MKSKILCALLALGTALTFLLNSPISVFAEEKAEISYKITYEDGKSRLALTPSDKKNTIYYTTDGSKPTVSSKIYSSRLTVKKATVIRAAEYDKKGKKVASVEVELKLKCIEPTLTAEKTEGGFLVSLSSKTKGSTVYYTTDGSKPKKTSAVYGEPFFVESGATVRAYAAKSGCKKSGSIKTKVEKAEGAKKESGVDSVCTEVLECINDYRAENGLSALTFDETLLKAAQLRAAEITENYSHDRPDGTSCFTVLDEVGFSYWTVGENIAWTEGTLSTPATVSRSWINSEPHRKNILNDNFEVTGIAAVRVGKTTYWVQLFAKKK